MNSSGKSFASSKKNGGRSVAHIPSYQEIMENQEQKEIKSSLDQTPLQ
jgi:hypothetical protein